MERRVERERGIVIMGRSEWLQGWQVLPEIIRGKSMYGLIISVIVFCFTLAYLGASSNLVNSLFKNAWN